MLSLGTINTKSWATMLKFVFETLEQNGLKTFSLVLGPQTE